MGSRRRRPLLLSLLAPALLLGAAAAGPGFSGLEDSPPQGQGPTMAPTSPFPSSAAERPGNHWRDPWLGSGTPAPLVLLHPSSATSSAGETPRGPPAEGLESPAPVTQFVVQEAGRGASVPGAGRQPRPPLLLTTRLMTLLPMLALLPGSASSKAVFAAGPTSSPSSAPDRFPGSDAGEGATEGWQPTSPTPPPGPSVQGVTQTSWTEMGPLNPQPGSEGLLATTAAGEKTRCSVAAEARGAGHRRPQGAATEIPGATGASAGQPAMNTTESGAAGVPSPSAATGQDWDVATITTQLAQLLPHIQSTGPLGRGAEVLLERPGGSEAYAASVETPGRHSESHPPEPRTAEGPFRPGPALPPPLGPPRSGAGARHAVEAAEERIIPGTFAGSPVSSVPNTAAPSPRTEATGGHVQWPPADGTLSSSAGGVAEAPRSPSVSSHLGTIVPPSSMGATTHLASRGSDPWSSGPPLLTLPVGLGWPSAGSVERPATALGAGQHSGVDAASVQSATASGAVHTRPVVSWEGPSTAVGEERGSWGPSEPLSTWSVKGADPTQSSPGPVTAQPKWPAKGGTSPSAAPGPVEAFTSHGESVGAAVDSSKGPRRATAFLTMQTSPRQAGEAAFVGRATEMGEAPISRILGRGTLAGWTESPTGSMAALITTKGGVLSAAPPRDPTCPSKMAVPTSETGGTGLHQPSTSADRMGRREWGKRPGAPMESSVWGVPRSPQGLEPVPAAATSVVPPGRSWHTWPPAPASEPGSDPPVASTWLLAVAPEEAATPLVPARPRDGNGRTRPQHTLVVENQPPLLKAAFLRIPCELVLAMEFSRSFQKRDSPEYQGLVLSINETVTPFLASLPGFQRLEVKEVRPGSVVVAFDALFLAGAPGLWAALNRSSLSERLPPGLWVANARVLRSVIPERHLDPCALLFSCHGGYECVAGENGSATCISMCHRDYCKNQGICTHVANHTPICQCPVGSDFWFLGARCDYKVTQQGLLGVACGLLLSLVVVGTAIAGLVIRRVRTLLLEARVDQTKSSYRRFCRLDDVSAHYWSEPWLASASSLDNPAFSNSEELLHLQILDTTCCSCQDGCTAPESHCKQLQGTPCISTAGRPSSQYNWAESSSSVNDPMIDSGKASEVSVSSWPLEPIQWSPFPAPHKLSREHMRKTQRPHSYCEGMELVSLERSWTA